MHGHGEVDGESVGRFPDLSRNINTNVSLRSRLSNSTLEIPRGLLCLHQPSPRRLRVIALYYDASGRSTLVFSAPFTVPLAAIRLCGPGTVILQGAQGSKPAFLCLGPVLASLPRAQRAQTHKTQT